MQFPLPNESDTRGFGGAHVLQTIDRIIDAQAYKPQLLMQPGLPGHNRSMLHRYWHYLVAGLLVAVFYSPAFRTNSCLVLGDYVDYTVAVRVFATAALREGRLPHWTYGQFGGFPFLSDPQAGFFYPLNLLLAAAFSNVGRSVVMDKFVLFHAFMLTMGAVFLARSLRLQKAGSVVCALICSFNGYIVMHLSHLVVIEAITCGVWAAGSLVHAQRRNNTKLSIASGMFLAAAIFGGHWQTALFVCYYVGLGGLLLALHQRFSVRSNITWLRHLFVLGLPFAFALLATAIQILPTYCLLQYSTRDKLLLADAMLYAWPLRQIPGLLFPNLYQPVIWQVPPHTRFQVAYANWGEDGAWEFMYHVGLCAFFLAIYGLATGRRRLITGLAGFGSLFILLASIRETAIYPILFSYMPGFKQVRIPPRMLFGIYIFWGLLAGSGVDAVSRAAANGTMRLQVRLARLCAATIAVLFIGGISFLMLVRAEVHSLAAAAGRVLVDPKMLELPERLTLTEISKLVRHQVAFAGFVGTALITWFIMVSRQRARGHLLGAAAIALTFVELAGYGMFKNVGSTLPGFTRPQNGFWELPPEEIPGTVLAGYPGPAMKNGGLVTGKHSLSGYNPLKLRWAANFLPDEKVPAGSRYEETRMDMWNASSIMIPTQFRKVHVPDVGTTRVMVLNWATLGRDDPQHRTLLTWDVTTSSNLRRLHLLANAACALGLPNGFPVAEFRTRTTDGEIITTYPVRLGHETAEWSYDAPGHARQAGHKKATVSYHQSLQPTYSDGLFYVATFDVDTTMPVASVEVEITAPSPVLFSISHLLLETTGSLEAHVAPGAAGYEVHRTSSNHWLRAAREPSTGNAWLVPTAKPVSYRRNYLFVYNAMISAGFDPAKFLLLDKRVRSSEQLQKLNASYPADFAGTASVVSNPIPEHITIVADANQRGWLVLPITWYPGWKALIDGEPGEVLQANGAQLALHVPAGRHQVELEFKTPYFTTGALISAVTWLLGLIYLVIPHRRMPL